MKNYILFISLCMLLACSGKKINKFSDETSVAIADLQDRRLSDSLYQYLKNSNAAYRKDAVLAFASIQDTLAIEKLDEVLRLDSDPGVRKAAAIALGQTPVAASAAVLLKALSSEKDEDVLREILESCGKTFTKDFDQLIAPSSGKLITEGLAWAYFRISLRGLADSALTVKAVDFLRPENTLETRLAASDFFTRGTNRINFVEAQLIESAQKDESPWIRASLAFALRKTKSANALTALKKILETDSDYRVRVNAVKALQEFLAADTKSFLFEALEDEHVNVKIAASEVIRNINLQGVSIETASLAKKSTHWRVRGNLYQASLRDSNTTEVVNQIMDLYKSENNPYGKAALLTALGQSISSWSFIDQELHQATIPVLKSSAASALVMINSNPAFDKSLQGELAKAYIRAIQGGDAAVIGIISGALTNENFGYKNVIKDYTFLYEAKNKLSLPKDNETLQPLEAAIAFFEGKELPAVKNEFNNPINWELVKTIPQDQKVLMKTSKGDIVFKLLVDEAPGSVANFVALINTSYFNSKKFHRVVPNFVIQDGCNRGDGWGSEDYSIRSEFSGRHYTEGSVGMASAGKDTEGTQWFITHSPTLHLDGRYSIFAVTESGMDAIHQIEVGDTIISVELIK